MSEDFGRGYDTWLRNMRKAYGLTQPAFAEKMAAKGVPWTRDQVASIENGRRHLRAYEYAVIKTVEAALHHEHS